MVMMAMIMMIRRTRRMRMMGPMMGGSDHLSAAARTDSFIVMESHGTLSASNANTFMFPSGARVHVPLKPSRKA